MKPTRFFLPVLFALVLPYFNYSQAAENNIQFRGNLENSRIQFLKNKKGNVAFMGGSITEMNGYRPMVADQLKKRFPETNFTFIDAGISSTCSNTGAFRLERDVLSKPIDLFFIEFAVNDDQDAHHSRKDCIRGLEGIIRHARKSNPNMDIIVTFFVNEGMLKTLQDGKIPLTIEAHDSVAKNYKVSTINLAKEVAERISANSLNWKQYGGVHPAPFGNAIAATMIDNLFNEAWKNPWGKTDSLKAHEMPAPLDPLSYEAGRFIDPKNAVIKSGWTLGVPDWKSLQGGKRDRFTSVPVLYASEAGAEITLEFEGTAVGAFIVAGPDAGIVLASIDGSAPKPVDLLHSYSKGLHYPRTVMFGT
ncbi:MAG: hypothetical protein JHC56_03360, partial [Gemmataceae bacterium]|nr:hypothetical protein [Gemmataceae bacterium]